MNWCHTDLINKHIAHTSCRNLVNSYYTDLIKHARNFENLESRPEIKYKRQILIKTN
jgi:hypothetical protein